MIALCSAQQQEWQKAWLFDSQENNLWRRTWAWEKGRWEVSAVSQACETWGMVQSAQRKLSITPRWKLAEFRTCDLTGFYSPIIHETGFWKITNMVRHINIKKMVLSRGGRREAECRKWWFQGDGSSRRIWIDWDGLLHIAEDCCFKMIFFILYSSSPFYKKKKSINLSD